MVDDADMGIDVVVRGSDLLSSTPQQIHLAQVLGYNAPAYAHVPLFVTKEGRRIAKREKDAGLDALMDVYGTPERILGHIAYVAGLVDVDEAHSAQTGSFAGKMKAALKLAADKDKTKLDLDAVTDEDAIDAYFQQIQDAREMPANISFFAFTATPKTETKVLFGRPGSRLDPKTGEPLPESFHLYPMRQAIEEGYILDVLKGYMPYKTAYKLNEEVVKDKLVDERAALRTIAQWESLHPTNVMEKAEFIIEHFVKNVAAMLNGQAKAMIVTSSRPSVVRY